MRKHSLQPVYDLIFLMIPKDFGVVEDVLTIPGYVNSGELVVKVLLCKRHDETGIAAEITRFSVEITNIHPLFEQVSVGDFVRPTQNGPYIVPGRKHPVSDGNPLFGDGMKATADMMFPAKNVLFWIPQLGWYMRRIFDQVPSKEDLETAKVVKVHVEPYDIHLVEEGRTVKATTMTMVVLEGEDIKALLAKRGIKVMDKPSTVGTQG